MQMSQKSRIVFTALAAIATLGVAQIAAGEAVSGATLADRFQALGEPDGINRTAKADREVAVTQTAGHGRTVLLKIESLADTSVLVRLPRDKEARNRAPARPSAKPAGDKKMATACEPPVSVLAEVAKLLQPGRCVT